MTAPGKPPSARITALCGLLGLAAAMGIGRFAFTPLFPLMQQHDGLTLSDGAWLAFANYLGYLAGALMTFAWPLSSRRAIRGGLALVALTTVAMAADLGDPGRLALRFAAGAASAFVLVGVAGWALPALAAAGRAGLAGWVFAGVGIGVTLAGLVALVCGRIGSRPGAAWVALGLLALGVLIASWPAVGTARVAEPDPAPRRTQPISGAAWSLIVAYGGYGLGYIIPATFLPAMARAVIADPSVFGWTWPVFGAAAALSTVVVARCFAATSPRTLFIGSLLVMAVGVLAPALSPGLWAIAISALAVGATFVVLTMVGFQEARRIAGGSPARVIAAMTTAFALGQLAGPVLVALGATTGASGHVVIPSLIATGALLCSTLLLVFGPGGERRGPLPPTPRRSSP